MENAFEIISLAWLGVEADSVIIAIDPLGFRGVFDVVGAKDQLLFVRVIDSDTWAHVGSAGDISGNRAGILVDHEIEPIAMGGSRWHGELHVFGFLARNEVSGEASRTIRIKDGWVVHGNARTEIIIFGIEIEIAGDFGGEIGWSLEVRIKEPAFEFFARFIWNRVAWVLEQVAVDSGSRNIARDFTDLAVAIVIGYGRGRGVGAINLVDEETVIGVSVGL